MDDFLKWSEWFVSSSRQLLPLLSTLTERYQVCSSSSAVWMNGWLSLYTWLITTTKTGRFGEIIEYTLLDTRNFLYFLYFFYHFLAEIFSPDYIYLSHVRNRVGKKPDLACTSLLYKWPEYRRKMGGGSQKQEGGAVWEMWWLCKDDIWTSINTRVPGKVDCCTWQ